MAEKTLFKNDFIEVTTDDENFYIQSFKPGFSLDEFNKVVIQNPQIRITSFTAVKSALTFAPKAKEKFGELKDKIQAEISPDGLKAFLILNVPLAELSYTNHENLKHQILRKLEEDGIVFGIKHEALAGTFENDKKILVAEGVTPEDGKDAIVNLYKLEEAKPKISDEKNVDHYELCLINRVEKDEWLGDRIDALPGKPGKNVKGQDIPQIAGKQINLDYDKNSIYEIKEGNKTVLRSIYTGAVSYVNGQITVSNHLEVPGNVDFSTGNINFDGCVTIKGTVDDNFMVQADGDIEILGELGVGNIRGIESRKGSVFIKGGISSKSKVHIKAARSIFVKYANNVILTAGHSVNIGYYCLNSEISAKEIIIDSSKGQVMGGIAEASARIVINTLGSPSEKRTLIHVKGINKEIIKNQIEDLSRQLEKDRNELAQYKADINYANEKKEPQAKIAILRDKLNKLNDNIKLNEEEKRVLTGLLKVRGNGEIIVQKKIYGNCSIEISNLSIEITREQNGAVFYISEGEIKQG